MIFNKDEDRKFAWFLAENCPITFAYMIEPIEKDVPFLPIQLSIDVGPGWFPLVREASLKIEQINRVLQLQGVTTIQVVQIKEKYGTLCYYTNYCNNEIDAIIEEVEHASGMICESCGGPGELIQQGWWRTICESCEEARHHGN